ncbi:radical SAM protein [Paraburkholderia tropica]|uniref:radical SAM protein n=1 Tax=Paraburkholderia tropica TaxID=92647 RepID=UPI002AB7BA99|nr:radical SAM protein [Paraburkholderia tropica]
MVAERGYQDTSRFLQRALIRPFVLNIETISICNAKCCFCPYEKAERKRGYMDFKLYEKIIDEYNQMGGGSLLLTPILGEFLLDKMALKRIAYAKTKINIVTISFTSNAIAISNFSDSDLSYLLDNVNFMNFSIGGSNREFYEKMFGVDKFAKVFANIKRLVEQSRHVSNASTIRLTFRSGEDEEQVEQSEIVQWARNEGLEVVIDNSFANWGGAIDANDISGAAFMRPEIPKSRKKNPCFMTYLGTYISYDGRVTACGCMDSEVVLEVGDCRTSSLESIWNGTRLKQFRSSFSKGSLAPICEKCTLYQDGISFSNLPEVQHYVDGRFPFGY